MSPTLSPLERLLVCRIDNLGDVVMVMPSLRWLKRQHPGLRIEMVVRGYAQALVQRMPWVDKVWTPETLKAAVADGEPPPQAVVHLQSSRELLRLCKVWGVALRVGNLLRSNHWGQCNRWVAFSKRRSKAHESWLCWRFLAKLFPDTPSPEAWADALTQGDWLRSKPQASSEAGVADVTDAARWGEGWRHASGPRVLLHPCSNGNGRQWPLTHFKALALLLLSAGWRVGVTGAASEREMLAPLMAELPPEVDDFVGRLSLDEFIDLIGSADALVASGTGPLHLASALGVHAVGVFPPIYPLGAERWRPIGPKVSTLQSKPTDSCRLSCSNLDCRCMREVAPEQVMEALARQPLGAIGGV